ncbi:MULTISPECIES: hypothetical protein [unclassified Sphingomonas]|uniref:hypothetical protein n=1 Tax=Sphingomonas TaxID=13687 RepID=UPI000965702F|nr:MULTISPECIES: hypothetical protein [unclassified Sphingomonas]MBN8810864.1 hypothetical protein [Sphingomonas sp.]OJY49253.1 MAG: hypothetical protein BGP17_11530 [Sphingomonas sp. 67-41]
MVSAAITGIIGFAGVLIGALLQRFWQHRKFLSDSKYEAYILFLKSLAGSGATKPDSEARWLAVSGMIEAKSRIALFGSVDVVAALGRFSADHQRVNSENFDELARIITLMRTDVGAGKIPDLDSHIRGLLFDVRR